MKAIYTLFLLFFSSIVFANNIQLQKVSLSDTNRAAKTVSIKMNISWEHSWRDSINWDAAWIIIKYKEPKDSAWKWKHGQLSSSGNNTGTATGVKIVVPEDLTGAFFYRSLLGSGNISSDNVKLLWNYGAAGVTNIDSVEVRVFATEMVYVPEGSYCLGDGNGTQRSDNSFQIKNAPNNYVVINDKWSALINTGTTSVIFPPDDAILSTNGIRISGMDGIDINNDKVADYANFPSGYKGYYSMKYKITQGQYADFLNTVCANDTTNAVLNNYLNQSYGYNNPANMPSVPKPLIAVWLKLGDYMTSSPADLQRHTIAFNIMLGKFTVSRPERAYSLMDMNKSLSFSEWFGLRPMSELEFEKSCRGPLPPSFDYPYRQEKAWGSELIYPIASINANDVPLTFSNIENGTEFFTDYNVTKRYWDPIGRGNGPGSPVISGTAGGDGGIGPYRVGIFATDTSSRISSGAGYYGIMDLSKMNSEIVIPISNPTYRGFSYSNIGKGLLSALGTNYSFPNITGTTPNTSYKYGNVSTRASGSNGFVGFRAVRLAPSDN